MSAIKPVILFILINEGNQLNIILVAGIIELALDQSADFEPDTKHSYSNTNYILLSKIMTKSLGYDHTQSIKSDILDPLQLENTYFSVKDIELETLMSGYYVGYNDDFKAL